MAEFKLGRIRFVYKNDWNASTVYYVDDVVKVNGKTYICVTGHTAKSDFNLDLDSAKWELFSDGLGWLGDWSSSVQYQLNDLVKYGSTVYICIDGHMSQGTLELDQAKWDVFSTTGLEWKSIWVAGTVYKVGDAVKYGGLIYRCSEAHTAAATDTLGLENDSLKWDVVNNGFEYKTNWSAEVRYKVNDIVKYGGGLWICTQFHTSGILFTTDEAKWAQFIEGLEFEDSWDQQTRYQPGDIVTFGGYQYAAKTNNLDAKPTTSLTDWDVFSTGFNFVGEWGEDSTNQDYRVGDVVTVGGYTYLCIEEHESGAQKPPSVNYWSRLNAGAKWKGNWSDATVYDLGDMVRHNNSSYIAVATHTSDETTLQNRPDQDLDGSEWNQLVGGSETSVLTTSGDIVYYSGGGATRLPIGQDGQVLKVSGEDLVWSDYGIINNVFYVAPSGSDATDYGYTLDKPFKTVRYGLERIEIGHLRVQSTTLLRRNRSFIQEELVEWVNTQVAGGSGIWAGFVNDNVASCRRDMGQILDALIWDMSHGGNERIREATLTYFSGGSLIASIDDEDEQLSATVSQMKVVIDAVMSNVAPGTVYSSFNQVIDATKIEEPGSQTLAENLLDILITAIDAQTDTGVPALLEPTHTLFVKTGEFTEVSPMIVPKRTAVVGDELRSTRITPAGSYVHTSEVDYSLGVLAHMETFLDDIATNTAYTKTTGNGETQVTTTPAGATAAGEAAANLARQMYDYIDYQITGASGDSVAPIYAGSNTPNTTTDYTYAIEALEENRAFIIAETTAYVQDTYTDTVTNTTVTTNVLTITDTSWMNVGTAIRFTGTTFGGISTGTTYYVKTVDNGTTFTVSLTRGGAAVALTTATGTATVDLYYDSAKCERDVSRYIDAIQYDLIYTGNYKSFIAAELYVNSVTGSEAENMFHMRNGTGLRNMTLSGLTGTLGSDNAYGTKRPSAGAYVSLDPGWGTQDQDVWIANKSPYVQNVSTFGTACVGMKVDGALHDGGYDSMVANDFTQVLSDGIGYWVTNLGRSELVSVFTYYNHIGYLSENGGKIRATNGNNSYGAFGSVAEGVDDTESPITATVNNRGFEAQVSNVYTDNDKIFALEYSNAGSSYTSENNAITFAGIGYGQDFVLEETRDDAVFEIRMLTSGEDYRSASNSPQTGNTTSITLAGQDTAPSVAYTGMRLMIIAGKGSGQYGYIQSYNAGTKVATIYRETDDQAGWEHIIPGTVIETTLDQTSTYIIEPRISVAAPSTPSYNGGAAPNSGTYRTTNVYDAIAYGNDVYVALSSTNTDSMVSTVRGSWAPGGDIFTAGGATPAAQNNIAYGKIGASHYFMSTPVASGTQGAYTNDNGATWTLSTLSATATWVDIAFGEGKFMAIAASGEVAVSTDGQTWTAGTTLPTIGNNYSGVAFGNHGRWVVMSEGQDTAYSDNDGAGWTAGSANSALTFKSIAFGNSKWVATATGTDTANYSLDGITWYATTLTASGDWTTIEYGQGVFYAVDETTGQKANTSKDGLNWVASTITFANNHKAAAFGNPSGIPTWVTVGGNGTNHVIQYQKNVREAFARCIVESGQISAFKILEPGSGYDSAPTVTITDPNDTAAATFTVRVGDGALGQPTFRDRGTDWESATATVTGDGFGDIYQNGGYVKVDGLTDVPIEGSNITFAGNSTVYKLVNVLGLLGSGPYTAELQLSPAVTIALAPEHNDALESRLRYSQVRLTGHDFLDIGTGNFANTNYPGDPAITPSAAKETVEGGGGRVFYTSTDQDGNFKVGELFSVEQSTGKSSLNADAFNLAGLQELQLGSVTLGSSNTAVNEFSTDGTFAANSDNIVPTQKAIRTYIQSQIGGGGATLNVNSITAGEVNLTLNTISNTEGNVINITSPVKFTGSIDGAALALNYFLQR